MLEDEVGREKILWGEWRQMEMAKGPSGCVHDVISLQMSSSFDAWWGWCIGFSLEKNME